MYTTRLLLLATSGGSHEQQKRMRLMRREWSDSWLVRKWERMRRWGNEKTQDNTKCQQLSDAVGKSRRGKDHCILGTSKGSILKETPRERLFPHRTSYFLNGKTSRGARVELIWLKHYRETDTLNSLCLSAQYRILAKIIVQDIKILDSQVSSFDADFSLRILSKT